MPAVAVIGMAGRFPGAPDLAAYWNNLRNGANCVSCFSERDLLEAGVSPQTIKNPRYVRAGGILGEIEWFDAAFFGFTPREAELLSPQQRLFMETCWEALEHGGYDSETYPGAIGVYGGTNCSAYVMMSLLAGERRNGEVLPLFSLLVGGDKDALCTRVSHKFDLRGPSCSVQTFCSTSLVSVHLATQQLLNCECDMALAGGVCLRIPEISGYTYHEGGIESPDGVCRPFDAAANGTVFGSGVGVVLLKRLDDAIAEADTIYAVIRGSAVNNDGSKKASYTAPSVAGQSKVIAESIACAGIRPSDITYVETHGTGTPTGDPVEIAALTRAFGSDVKKQTIPIGSVKGSIGHLDTASGIASLLKVILMLSHRTLVPSVNYRAPNPQIDFENSPFCVNVECRAWQTNGRPRFAGVSSFGLGGTNAHLVVEEFDASQRVRLRKNAEGWQLVPLSARSQSALGKSRLRLRAHLKQNPDLQLQDVAHTLQTGRRHFAWRNSLVCKDLPDLVAKLENENGAVTDREFNRGRPPEIVFLFPGQGSQYPRMTWGLYQHEPVFKAELDRCCAYLAQRHDLRLLEILFDSGNPAESFARLSKTDVLQPALFVVEYALAKLFMAHEIVPAAMMGHSVGEYVAACLAGVFSLESALSVIVKRGSLMSAVPGGAMLAVSLPAEKLRALLPPSLSLASVNSPLQCVVSGPVDQIRNFRNTLEPTGVKCHSLNTSHGFHSAMMDPILDRFRVELERTPLTPPRLPLVSNLTGEFMKDHEATDPGYWTRHLRHTVQFSAGVRHLLQSPDRLFLEVGPGQTLSNLVKQNDDAGSSGPTLPALAGQKDPGSERVGLIEVLGRLWSEGVPLNWKTVQPASPRKVALPTYPFERKKFWLPVATAIPGNSVSPKKQAVGEWLLVPTWKRLERSRFNHVLDRRYRWLVMGDKNAFTRCLARSLTVAGQEVVSAEAGRSFDRIPATGYALNWSDVDDYRRLVNELRFVGSMPDYILTTWDFESTTLRKAGNGGDWQRSFRNYFYLAKALGEFAGAKKVEILVVSTETCQVFGDSRIDPCKSLVLGPVHVINQEYHNVTCRHLDFDRCTDADFKYCVSQVIQEAMAERPSDRCVAFRHCSRWVPDFAAVRALVPDASKRFRAKGTYLLTGGLGGVAFQIAKHLASKFNANLVLTGRVALPAREGWGLILQTHPQSPEAKRISRIEELERLGSCVVYQAADVSDLQAMQKIRAEAISRFGGIHGVMHFAGTAGGGTIQNRTWEQALSVLTPKVVGAQVICDVFQEDEPDFIALFSSLAALMGGFGQADYAAANAFLDALSSSHRPGGRVISINWDTWLEDGMAVNTDLPDSLKPAREQLLKTAMTAAEGIEAFEYALAAGQPRIAVSTRGSVPAAVGLSDLLGKPATAGSAARKADSSNLDRSAPPRVETKVLEIWRQTLGLDEIGARDNLFLIGGNSFTAIQLLARLHDEFQGCELSIADISEHPTVESMAALLKTRTSIRHPVVSFAHS